jgi:hypothetical protein
MLLMPKQAPIRVRSDLPGDIPPYFSFGMRQNLRIPGIAADGFLYIFVLVLSLRVFFIPTQLSLAVPTLLDKRALS